MKLPLHGRTLALVAVIVPLLGLLVYVALRSGPMAPVAVTEIRVESRAIRPSLFGIGTVEARYTYKIGPTFAGRVQRLDAQVGEHVRAGQLLGEMAPVDLNERVLSQEAGLKRAEAAIDEASARHAYAQSQARRYEELFEVRSVSEEVLITKRQELAIARAALVGVKEERVRARFELEGAMAQRSNLRLVAPVDGIIIRRDADPGTTVVAGQSVVELIAPQSLGVHVRFDQVSAAGLAADLPAQIVLRSRQTEVLQGRVLRLEPVADVVTEEMLAKVIFDQLPAPLPPLGELAEVTIDLPALPAVPVIPNAAVQRQGNQTGVWRISDGAPLFTPVRLGRSNLDGLVQVLEGLSEGDRIVLYSEKALGAHSRIQLVERIPGVAQ
ncbi:MAG: efflux RND transporter periplasmic adaptor subunit [Gammaproteobacteria bacterium]|nr:efflux RND transporter periplasmic adaptor subunit [Gammaproteobacteria bacterium]